MRALALFVIASACTMRAAAPCAGLPASGAKCRLGSFPVQRSADEVHKGIGCFAGQGGGPEGGPGGANGMVGQGVGGGHGEGLGPGKSGWRIDSGRKRWHAAACNDEKSGARCDLGTGNGGCEEFGRVGQGFRDAWGTSFQSGPDEGSRLDPTGMAEFCSQGPNVVGSEDGCFGVAEMSVEEFLASELMVPASQLDMVLRACPQLLRLSVSRNLRPAVHNLISRGMSVGHVQKAFMALPRVLSHHVSHNAGKVLDLLLELGCPRDKLGKMVARAPKLLGLSAPNNLRPTISFLCDEVGVPRSKLWKIIHQCPELLSRSLDKHLMPACLFLEHLGIPRDKLGAFIGFYPQALCKSIQHKLRPVVEYLVIAVGVPRGKVAGVLLKKPQLLGYAIEKMQRAITFLGAEVGVSRDGIRDMVVRFPSLLGYSVDQNLRPTVSYIRENANVDAEQLARDAVL